jgi:GTP-binding protein Era
MTDKKTKCGYVAIVGRPNVGKSTLLNTIMGKKISITSRKPQTTRHRLLGIKTLEEAQIVYVDTPGLHQKNTKAINRYMNRAVLSALHDVDAVVFVVDVTHYDELDQWVLKHLKNVKAPVILAVNKIDRLDDRAEALPFIEKVSEDFDFHTIMPISAKNSLQTLELEQEIITHLPESPFLFDEDTITDKDDRFMVTEFVREKLMRNLGEEIPYGLTVTVEAYELKPDILRVSAVIWVEKESHKSIVIGAKGERLKIVGRDSRIEMEAYFDRKVFIQLWVKVKSGWSDNEQLLQQFGYEE